MSTDIRTLTAQIRLNRFLPIPPEEENFVGDGQFLAIGCEFLEYFVEMGGLLPRHRVLDIGCGLGRMALPLTQYLQEEEGGHYEGIDIHAPGIAWATTHITARYPHFHFQHKNYHNSLYNPAGTETLGASPLPYASESFDFIFLTSVFTHLPLNDMLFYLREIQRLLAAGGTAFLSLFLLTPARRPLLESGQSRPIFTAALDWPVSIANPEHPMAAVALAEDYLRGMLQYFGLRLRGPIVYGNWAGGEAVNFQDLVVLEKAP